MADKERTEQQWYDPEICSFQREINYTTNVPKMWKLLVRAERLPVGHARIWLLSMCPIGRISHRKKSNSAVKVSRDMPHATAQSITHVIDTIIHKSSGNQSGRFVKASNNVIPLRSTRQDYWGDIKCKARTPDLSRFCRMLLTFRQIFRWWNLPFLSQTNWKAFSHIETKLFFRPTQNFLVVRTEPKSGERHVQTPSI